MTPTMFDRRAADIVNAKRVASGGKPGPWPPRVLQYNAVLAHYGRFLQELACDGGYGFVDMFGPLNRITMRERKTDPKFTLIADAVHPGPDGQALMACAILEDMHPNRLASALRIAVDGDRVEASAEGGRVSEARQEAGGIRFTFAAESLPWVLPEKAALGDRLANAGRRFSLERLQAVGLKPGRYALKIGGETVGEYDHGAFTAGIELQRNAKTPQYRQAARIAELNRIRNESVIVPLRNQWLATREWRNANKAVAENPGNEALAKRVKELEAKHSDAGRKISELQEKSKAMEEEIYRENQPQPRPYEIVRRLPIDSDRRGGIRLMPHHPPIRTVGAHGPTMTPPCAHESARRAAGRLQISTLDEPLTMTSGGPTQTAMSVTRAAGSPAIRTVGAPGPEIGPPTCGTTPVTMGRRAYR